MSGRRDLPIGGGERAKHGCILSFENAEGRRLVLHREGAPTRIVAGMCDEALALDQTFRVISYSTPSTVYGDLTGARANFQNADGFGQAAMLPEKVILRRAGRLEMLHPRLALVVGKDARVVEREYQAARKRKGSK